ncbi:MAG: aminodeoxychorismate/anthranilate synthase component II [Candidatus Dormibacteraeota bacterium]|nr:aminodeoxychorismate/anthranilate synthase component II [Candidatus Dormibacteraeota bacterium]
MTAVASDAPLVAVLDNYDSFTYNLVQLLQTLGARTAVYRNDAVDPATLARHDALVISPGPGRPEESGVSVAAVHELGGTLPILGVCLGHQAVGVALGARVGRRQPVHGKVAEIGHDGTALFAGLPDPLQATRYHSLVIEPDSLPPVLLRSAWTREGLVMGVRHRSQPTFGVQFHPESILTPDGGRLLQNFLRTAA